MQTTVALSSIPPRCLARTTRDPLTLFYLFVVLWCFFLACGSLANHVLKMSLGDAGRNHSRMLFVKNLNYAIQGASCHLPCAPRCAPYESRQLTRIALGSDLYELFGRYGLIRQIRLGNAAKTRGTAYVTYEEQADAKRAVEQLNGFHLQDRYIVVLYHMPQRLTAKAELTKREADLAALKQQHNITDDTR